MYFLKLSPHCINSVTGEMPERAAEVGKNLPVSANYF
jgi:hypothetical protein